MAKYLPAWLLILGVLYYVFGQQIGFDRRAGVIHSVTMPPPMSYRLIELDQIMNDRGWTDEEVEEVKKLTEERNKAWENQPTLKEVLGEKYKDRKAIRDALVERGLMEKDINRFIGSLEKDNWFEK